MWLYSVSLILVRIFDIDGRNAVRFFKSKGGSKRYLALLQIWNGRNLKIEHPVNLAGPAFLPCTICTTTEYK